MFGETPRERSLFYLMMAQLALGFRGGIIAPILSLYIRQQGMSISQVGLLGTVSLLGWLVFEPLSGVVADRIRKKWMMVFAILGSTIIYALYPSAGTFQHFLFLYFAMTSVMSAYAIALKALQVELLPKEGRGKTYGRYLSVISLGGVMSPLIGGWITENRGYALPFYLSALVGVVGLAAVLLMDYDDKASKDTATRVEGGWRTIFTASLVGIYAVRGLYFFSVIFRSNFLPIYLHESPRFNASETQIGTYMTLIRLAVAGSQAFLGTLCDRYGAKRMIVASISVLGATYLGLVYGQGLALLYMVGLVQGLFMAAADLGMMMHLMSVMPDTRTGMVMGIYSESENVGGIVASPSLGYVYEGSGAEASVLMVSAVLFLTAFLSVIRVRERDG
jgi:MFS family permease